MIAEVCTAAGLDLARDPLPVSPAAHYMCGGVDTDLEGRTSVPGLFAAGEVACTGVHGANRLASNSLLEGLVFGARAAVAMKGPGQTARLRPAREAVHGPVAVDTRIGIPDPDRVPDLLWQGAGLIRDEAGLAATMAAVAAVSQRLEAELTDDSTAAERRTAAVALVGFLVARAALRRGESRGGHRRTDCPDRDDVNWKFHVADRQGAFE
jgi:L-aspartate oxidase